MNIIRAIRRKPSPPTPHLSPPRAVRLDRADVPSERGDVATISSILHELEEKIGKPAGLTPAANCKGHLRKFVTPTKNVCPSYCRDGCLSMTQSCARMAGRAP